MTDSFVVDRSLIVLYGAKGGFPLSCRMRTIGQDRSLALPHTARSPYGHALSAYAVEYLGHPVAEVAGQLPPFICGAETWVVS